MIDLSKHKETVKKRLKCTDEEIKEIFKLIEERMKPFASLPDTEQEQRAKTLLSFMLRKRLSSNTKQFEGLFLFEGDITQTNERFIDSTLEVYYKDKIKQKELIDGGVIKLVNGQPIVMDAKATLPSGSKNYNFGKPLLKRAKKTVSGIVKVGETFKKMNLTLNDEDAKKEIKIGKVCDFSAVEGKESDDGIKNLYLAGNSDMVFKEKEVNVIDVIKNYYKDNIIDTKKLRKTYEGMDEKTRGYKLFIFEGDLINDNSQSQNPSIKISVPMDFDEILTTTETPESIHIKLPQNIALGFNAAPESRLTIAGTCWLVGAEDNKLFGVSAKFINYEKSKVETKSVKEVKPTAKEDW